MKAKEAIKIVTSLLGIVGLMACFGFAVSKQNDQEIKSFSVSINALEGDAFIGEKYVKSMVHARLDSFVGKAYEKINLFAVEKLVEQEPAVKNAEAYLEVNGHLKVKVALKTALVRVKPEGKKGYYIDEQGDKMPWVSSFTPRVLTVSGWLDRYLVNQEPHASLDLRKKLFFSNLYDFAYLVYLDEFWSKQILQVYINYQGDAELVCLMGNQKIVLGSLGGPKVKLEKLKKYYEEVVSKVGWTKYQEVNLKFENQIVCK